MAKKKLGLGGGLGQFRQEVKELTILPELKAFIPPLMTDESDLLRESIKSEGVKEPIDVWVHDGKHVIVDGHNRYTIAKEEKVSFSTKEHQFKDIEEVKEWMLKKQLGRRNLSDSNRTYLIGLLYNKSKAEKGKHKRNNSKTNTAGDIAKNTGTSVRTVKSAGDFASGIDKLVPELKEHVLSGEKKVTKAEVQDLAKSDVKEPIKDVEQLKEEAQKVQKKKKPEKAKAEKNIPVKEENQHKPAKKEESAEHMTEDEYLEQYMTVKDDFQSHFKGVDELVLFSVLNDFLEWRSNLSDLIKLANGGYTILRIADTPTIHIKHFTTAKNSWKTLENGFKSKAERDRRLKELLKDAKTIRG